LRAEAQHRAACLFGCLILCPLSAHLGLLLLLLPLLLLRPRNRCASIT
jgi:hypothetical protein